MIPANDDWEKRAVPVLMTGQEQHKEQEEVVVGQPESPFSPEQD
jgi:hypothetical protein